MHNCRLLAPDGQLLSINAPAEARVVSIERGLGTGVSGCVVWGVCGCVCVGVCEM